VGFGQRKRRFCRRHLLRAYSSGQEHTILARMVGRDRRNPIQLIVYANVNQLELQAES